jgi:dipeptidase D
MIAAVPGAVETSTSLNVAGRRRRAHARVDDAEREFSCARRGRLAFRGAGSPRDAEIEVVRLHPPWRPTPARASLATARDTYARLFDAEPRLDVVHGGLECAVIGAKLPGVDMVSIGPEIVGPHAPGERLSISGRRALLASAPSSTTSPGRHGEA